MERTEDLIARLSGEGSIKQQGIARHVVLPLLLACILCFGATALVLDDPFPTHELRGWLPMIIKWGFSVSLLLVAAFALNTLGRPARPARLAMAGLALPFAYIGCFVALALIQGDQPFPGVAWQRCLLAMGIMSPIGFAAAILATRWLAPTNTHRTGLMAGFFGGALAMTAYAPFCPGEGAMYFMAFYLAPIMAMAGIGWLAGPKLLRW